MVAADDAAVDDAAADHAIEMQDSRFGEQE